MNGLFFNRYWAITDPFNYPIKMSDKRAAYLIIIVWICSGSISFPAIAWWRLTAEGVCWCHLVCYYLVTEV